jgi:hypothetical protein
MHNRPHSHREMLNAPLANGATGGASDMDWLSREAEMSQSE